MNKYIKDYQKAFNDYQDDPSPKNQKIFLDFCDKLLNEIVEKQGTSINTEKPVKLKLVSNKK